MVDFQLHGGQARPLNIFLLVLCASAVKKHACYLLTVSAAELARKGGLDWDSLPRRFRKRVGCKACNGVGYKRRTVIAETLEVTQEIGRALRNDVTVDELRVIAVKHGMTTMAADGIRRAANGETTLEEVLRVIG